MIEPKSTDVGNRVVCQSLGAMSSAPGVLTGFNETSVFVTVNGSEQAFTRMEVQWEEVAQAHAVFADARLQVEMIEPPCAPMRINGGWLFWPDSGLFQRPDGTKGSGGATSLVRAIKGGTVPAVIGAHGRIVAPADRADTPAVTQAPAPAPVAIDPAIADTAVLDPAHNAGGMLPPPSFARSECIYDLCPRPTDCQIACQKPKAQ